MKNKKISVGIIITLTVALVGCIVIYNMNSSSGDEASKSGGNIDIQKSSICSDDNYNVADPSERTIPFTTYVEFYSEGHSPIPEGERCKSDISKISEVFPDQNLATCIAEAFGVSNDAQISQHLLDNVAALTLSNIAQEKHPDSVCLENIDKITDLSGLEKFRNLRTIMMRLPIVSDVSALSNMPFLIYVDLRETAVIDVSPLAKLDNLQDIFLPLKNEGINIEPLTERGYSVRG